LREKPLSSFAQDSQPRRSDIIALSAPAGLLPDEKGSGTAHHAPGGIAIKMNPEHEKVPAHDLHGNRQPAHEKRKKWEGKRREGKTAQAPLTFREP
jgi:hypothetical protein